MSLLSVDNLSIGYETKNGMVKAVDGISFSLEKGRPLGFVGESGCGKTTIGMTLMGLLPDNAKILSGSVRFQTQDLVRLTEDQWRSVRGKDIAMIFQAAMNALNPVYRVDDQVREAILAHRPDISDKELNHRIRELFELVEIPYERIHDYPHEYSGGMKQRVIIAMALACQPQVIIADEPTTALDVIVQDQILEELRAIQSKLNTGLIFISHDIAVVASICEDICVMYGGQIVETGTRKEVFSSPRHPYTKTLLGSYLSLDNEEHIIIPDMRESADLTLASGCCRFQANCTACDAACKSDQPTWIDISPTHKALCCDAGIIRNPHD
ncbi:MAG TPA: ABC transporter ATP-binding protein [Desulfobacteraceae bacterium]|mgnify:CR=1 FL=1|nr:ABC transporter ATP-binding protein [Desulfobacteraceae bacterium]|tara:strand:- start:19 stop:996 length:978 start_codon:yes stop_codon:yes gene_type:complete